MITCAHYVSLGLIIVIRSSGGMIAHNHYVTLGLIIVIRSSGGMIAHDHYVSLGLIIMMRSAHRRTVASFSLESAPRVISLPGCNQDVIST